MSPNIDPSDIDDVWPAAWSLALADAALVEAGSKAIFDRGAAYARDGAVEIVDEDPMPEPAVRARVAGSETYDVEVWIEADAVAGECTCPHAADGWFCKHQVALAIVWRQRLAGMLTPSSAAVGVRPTRTAIDRRQALHAFLHGQEAASLADKLFDLATRDRQVERELQQWRKLSRMDGDWAGIRRVVSEMLSPRRDFIAWDEGSDYVSRASAVLPVLEGAIARDPSAAVSLCLHALRGAWAVVEQADDSDGVIAEFAAAIGEKFVAALQAAPDQPKRFADVYLDLRLDEPFSAFDPRAAEAAMGEAALTAFRQTLRSRWQAAQGARGAPEPVCQRPSTGGAARMARGQPLETLERLHLEQLELAGEIDEALAVLWADLSTAAAHGRLIRFLEAHGRFREAFSAAEAALKLHPGDDCLENDLLRCYERDGWTEEAFALRFARFERWPALDRYQAVVAAGAAAGRPADEVRAALFAVLIAEEERVVGETGNRAGRPTLPGRRAPVASSASHRAPVAPDVSLRAAILCSEARWLEAWAIVQPPNTCAPAQLKHIARSLPPTHHPEAVRVLTQLLEREMRGATSPYREALALVGDIGRRLPAADRAAWLLRLRVEFKAKRNFIRDLPGF